ncbi:MAG: TonB family protein [Pseudomonadota bacterium]
MRTEEKPSNSAEPLAVMLCGAIAAHALFILGVSFAPVPKPTKQTMTLDVILVQSQTDDAPDDPDLLAQANQEGGGNSDQMARPSSPLPSPLTGTEATIISASPPTPQSAGELQNSLSEQPTDTAPTTVLTQQQTDVDDKAAYFPPVPKPRPRQLTQTDPNETIERDTTRDLPSPDLDAPQLAPSHALASLNAEVARKLEAYANRPRKKWITARTKESKYAAYMDEWRSKVERVGNLNYPDSARRDRLSGNLLLDVALRADGTVKDIVIRRSSGHRVLDDAAIRIVRLAAPYSPFPKPMREETDVLHIERTWEFLSNNRLSTGQ